MFGLAGEGADLSLQFPRHPYIVHVQETYPFTARATDHVIETCHFSRDGSLHDYMDSTVSLCYSTGGFCNASPIIAVSIHRDPEIPVRICLCKDAVHTFLEELYAVKQRYQNGYTWQRQ
jgi:hypothetical protein